MISRIEDLKRIAQQLNRALDELDARRAPAAPASPACEHEWDYTHMLASYPVRWRCKKCGEYSGAVPPASPPARREWTEEQLAVARRFAAEVTSGEIRIAFHREMADALARIAPRFVAPIRLPKAVPGIQIVCKEDADRNAVLIECRDALRAQGYQVEDL